MLVPDAELEVLVREIAATAAGIPGDAYVGTYVEGSFALGAGDRAGDVDFFVVVRAPLSATQERGVRRFHRDLPAREGFWCRHVEGSYALLDDLRSPEGIGREWLFVDHGTSEMTWDRHGNDAVHRWVCREHGIVIDGPPPASIIAPVSPDQLRDEARQELPTVVETTTPWCDLDVAWCQRYLVTTCARVLFTIERGEVASKARALRWAMDTLDPRWRPTLQQTMDDRAAFSADEIPRPGFREEALQFAAYCIARDR